VLAVLQIWFLVCQKASCPKIPQLETTTVNTSNNAYDFWNTRALGIYNFKQTHGRIQHYRAFTMMYGSLTHYPFMELFPPPNIFLKIRNFGTTFRKPVLRPPLGIEATDLRIAQSKRSNKFGVSLPEDGNRVGFRKAFLCKRPRRWTKSKERRLCQWDTDRRVTL